MSKFFTTIVVCVSLISVNLALAGEPDVKLHEKCLYPTVQIAKVGASGFGSGVIVRSEKIESGYLNVVLTCKHVIDEMDQMVVIVTPFKDWSVAEMDKRTKYIAKTYAKYPKFDIAIVLFVSPKKMPTAELGLDEKLYIGNDLNSFGCALRQIPRMDTAVVTGVTKDSLRSDLMSVPGDSGGPVYHNYKLVALKQAFFGTNLGGSYFPIFEIAIAVRTNTLIDWAKTNPKVAVALKKDAPIPQLDALLMSAETIKMKN